MPRPEDGRKARYEIQSPGNGGWKVSLWKADGTENADFLLLGPDALHNVELTPGRYLITAERLGSGKPEIQLIHDLSTDRTIHLDRLQVEQQLKSIKVPLPKASKSQFSIIAKQMTRGSLALGSKVFLRSYAAKELAGIAVHGIGEENIGVDITSVFRRIRDEQISQFELDSLPERVDTEAPDADIEVPDLETSQTFSIGIARDIAHEEADQAPSPGALGVDAQRNEDGTLVLQFENGPPWPGPHVVSISVEGTPTIRVPLPFFHGGIRIRLAPISVLDATDTIVSIEAIDHRIQALVASLAELSRSDAMEVLRWATESSAVEDAIPFLAHKREDFWAATAAALVLIRTERITDYVHWTRSLAEWAPHIPDTEIIAAWAEAASAEDDTNILHLETLMLERLKKSRQTGAPTFVVSNQLATDMLTSLAKTAEDLEVRKMANEELGVWKRHDCERLFPGPYMIWQENEPGVNSGSLPSERFLIVSEGLLTSTNGFVPIP